MTTDTNEVSNTPRTDASKVDKVGMTFVWVEFAQQLERELAASEAEVERLKKKFKRAIEISDEFWDNQKQAVLVYHQELADELDSLKATLNPDKK
jgi:hypothetical protein